MTNKYYNVKTGIKTGNITLDANTGNITTANANVRGLLSALDLSLTGNVRTNIVPNANATLNLGNSAHRFATVYANVLDISGNITLGTQTISSNTYGVIFSGNIYSNNANFDGTLTANVANINDANISNLTINTQLTINSTIQSTSTDSGSIVTQGGAGVEKDLYVGGTIHLANNNGGKTSKVYLAYSDLSSGLEFKFNT
jgi:hypothetical protein